uniref:Uncharacterized protein n=1 Tax=Leersia perrieri TaxID=77586 RepID=A0A0D9WMJ6_9ORYZ
MHVRAFLPWLLVATLLLCSSTCSSSRAPIGMYHIAAGAVDIVGDYGGGVSGENVVAARRLLRTAPAPPAPLPNKMRASSMPVSPPARIS